jgi:hypothetical protein
VLYPFVDQQSDWPPIFPKPPIIALSSLKPLSWSSKSISTRAHMI